MKFNFSVGNIKENPMKNFFYSSMLLFLVSLFIGCGNDPGSMAPSMNEFSPSSDSTPAEVDQLAADRFVHTSFAVSYTHLTLPTILLV